MVPLAGLTASVCGYCGCNCGVYLQRLGHEQLAALPSQATGNGSGRLCLRGWQVGDLWKSPRRVRRPRILRDGRQIEVDWPEALRAAAEGLKQFAPSEAISLGVLCSGHLTNEDAFAAQEFARQVLGTQNVDNLGRALDGAAIWGLEAALCRECRSRPLARMAESDCFLVLNSNLVWESPQAAAWIVRARETGTRVVLLDEIGGGFAAHADKVLLHRPGARGLVLLMLLNALGGVLPHGPEHPEEQQAGVSASEIAELADLLARAVRPAIVASANAIQRPQEAYLIGQLVTNLSSGGSSDPRVYLLPSYCNTCGVTQMGMAPQNGGAGVGQMLAGGLRGLVLIDVGVEVFVGSTGLRKLREATAFVCALAPYESETAAMADVVLPMAGWSAYEGTITGCDGQVWGLAAQGETAGGRPVAAILAELAGAMGREMPPVGIEEIRARISSAVEGYANLDWHRTRDGAAARLGPRYSPAAEEGGELDALAGEAVPVAGQSPELPLVAIVRRDDAAWAFDPRARAVPILERELAPRRAPYVTIGLETAKASDLRPGRQVTVRTAFGSAEATVRLQEGLPEGVVVVPWHCRDMVFTLFGPGEVCERTGTLSHGPTAAALSPPGRS